MLKKIEQASKFVHAYLMETGKEHEDEPWGPKYRWEHTLRVVHWVWILANEENADITKSVFAALFHDVSHFVSKDYRKHGEKSAEITKGFLLREGYPKDFVEDVSYAVKSHVAERNPMTLEAKILQDADTLDRFGHFRILLFGKTADLSNLEELKKEVQSFLEYLGKVERGEFGPMWTKIGEEKVVRQIKVYRTVYSGIFKEIDDTKTPSKYV